MYVVYSPHHPLRHEIVSTLNSAICRCAVIYTRAESELPDGCFVTTDKPGSGTGPLQIPLKSQAEWFCALQEISRTQSFMIDSGDI